MEPLDMENKTNQQPQTEQQVENTQSLEEQADQTQSVQTEQTQQEEVPEGYRIDFTARYIDFFESLEETDKADGTNKKPRRLFILLTLLMCVQVIGYAYTGNGFMLIFAIVLGAMALLLRKNFQKANKAIAKAFEEEGNQRVIVGEKSLFLNEQEVPYSEIGYVYKLKHCFSILYQGNHTYVLPKAVLEEEQAQEFERLMQQKVPEIYSDKTKK